MHFEILNVEISTIKISKFCFFCNSNISKLFKFQKLMFSQISFLENFDIFDIFPGCQDLHPGTIQGIKLHTNRRFLSPNLMKNHDFSSNVHFQFRYSHSTQNFIIYSEKNQKSHSSHFGRFRNRRFFHIFPLFCLFFYYKGPYQPIFSEPT